MDRFTLHLTAPVFGPGRCCFPPTAKSPDSPHRPLRLREVHMALSRRLPGGYYQEVCISE
jgi:hypothetical protein